MGTVIETDAAVDYATEIATPAAQASAWYLMGGTQDATLRNLADPTRPATPSKALPVVAPGYVTLGGNAADAQIATGVAEPNDFTLFMVARASAGTDSIRAISSFVSNPAAGASLRFSSGSILAGRQTDAFSTAVLAVPDRTTWALYVARFTRSGEIYFADLTRGRTATVTTAAQVPSTVPFSLGSNPGAPAAGATADMALAAIYPLALSEAQIGEVAAFIRSEMAITLPGVAV